MNKIKEFFVLTAGCFVFGFWLLTNIFSKDKD